MVGAFNPISPAAAIALMDSAGASAATALADFAAAGLVKTYASHIHIHDSNGVREVRGGRVDRDIWDRIIGEGKIEDVFTVGSVRLPASSSPLVLPKVTATGIRFDEKSVAIAAEHYGIPPAQSAEVVVGAPSVPNPKPVAVSAPVSVPESPAGSVFEPVPVPRAVRKRMEIPEGALQLDVDETAAVLGIGRTSVYKLIGQGALVKTKTLNCTRITVESIRAHVATQS